LFVAEDPVVGDLGRGENQVPHVRLPVSHSGKSVHRGYLTQGQEAFLEGHIAAFEEIGGVPTRHIRYDNLTSAVQKVIYGQSRARVENQR
jgi:hypothetical protein